MYTIYVHIFCFNISPIWIKCRIPGTWYDSSTVMFTVDKFWQHRKKILSVTVEEYCQWLLNNHASDCWTITPVTVEQLCQPSLNNHASDCWTFVLMSDYWTIVPVTVEELSQPLLKNHANDCWSIMPATVKQSCHWLLKNRHSCC